MNKTEMIGLRMPKDLVEKMDALRDKESLDRSTIFLRALRYWVEVGGNITTYHQYLKRLDAIENNVEQIAKDINSIKQVYDISADQQQAINSLVKLIPKR